MRKIRLLTFISIIFGFCLTLFSYYGNSSLLVLLWMSPGIYRSIKFPNVLQAMQNFNPHFSYHDRVGALWLDTGNLDIMTKHFLGLLMSTLMPLIWEET